MNGKTAKLLKRWATKADVDYRRLKRWWTRLDHICQGKHREIFNRVLKSGKRFVFTYK